MANAKRDDNYVPTLIAVSNADGVTPVTLYADPTTHRLLVSATAGTLDDLSDVVITSGAQGDILYHNGTNWVNLVAGTNGQFLTTGGASANPSWTTSGTGTVTSVSVVTANGVSGSVATATTTPAITLTLGAITPSSVNVSGLTASEIVITDASKNLASAAVATYPSLTELTYVKGVTSAIQTQLGLKAPLASPTFTGTVTIPTPFTIGAVSMTATGTELNYVAGVTSAIQTQIDGKAATGQTFYIGTTQIAINRASAALTLAGITLTTPDIGTPSAGILTNATGLPVAGITASTITALGVGSLELGHATDTTLARVSAGVVSIEGVNVVTISSTDTLSNKTLTTPKFADLGYIADANGNEIIILDTTTTAVNEFTVVNAARGAPAIQATGGDTNIGITLTPKGAGIVKGELKRFMVRLTGNTTDNAVATTVGGDYRISNRAITLKSIGAYVDTAGTTGTMTIDVNEAGTTIMTTNKITLDTTEKSSETAATAPALTDTAIAADAIITFDVDAIHTTAAKGLVCGIDYVYA